MKILEILKLAKQIQKFAETETEQGLLISDGALEVGTAVYVEDEEGNVTAAPDGEYTTEKQIIVVAEGVVAEIKDKEETKPETEEKPEGEETKPENLEGEGGEETKPEDTKPEDDKDAKIAELEAKVAELEAAIVEKDAKIAELEAKVGETEAELNAANEKLSAPVNTETKTATAPKMKTYIRR